MTRGVFIYKPGRNGPLSLRVRHLQIVQAKRERAREDRDLIKDSDQEPDLSHYPCWCAAFFGANPPPDDTLHVDEDDVHWNADEAYEPVTSTESTDVIEQGIDCSVIPAEVWVMERYAPLYPQLWDMGERNVRTRRQRPKGQATAFRCRTVELLSSE